MQRYKVKSIRRAKKARSLGAIADPVTIPNFSEYIKKYQEKNLLDQEAIDCIEYFKELIPYVEDSDEIKKELELALEEINLNIELNQKEKGIKDEPISEEKKKNKEQLRAKALLLKMKMAKVKLGLQGITYDLY